MKKKIKDLYASPPFSIIKESLLIAAARYGSADECRHLIAQGVNVNWSSINGDTSLLVAVSNKNVDAALVLIEAGASISCASVSTGDTPLHVAYRLYLNALIPQLIIRGAKTYMKNKEGLTPAECRGKCENFSQNPLIFPQTSENRPISGTSLCTSNIELRFQNDISASAEGMSMLFGGASNETQNSESGFPRDAKEELKFFIPLPESRNRTKRPESDQKCRHNKIRLGGTSPMIKPSAVGIHRDDERSKKMTPPADESDKDSQIHSMTLILKEKVKELKSAYREISGKEAERLRLTMKVQEAEEMIENLKKEVEKERREKIDSSYQHMNLSQLLAAESKTRKQLSKIVSRREQLELEDSSSRDHKLCVICQDTERCILLLPCKHLCLCSQCSKKPAVNTCPLCRRTIREKMTVFS